MANSSQKLNFFLEMSLSDQQFPLIVLNDSMQSQSLIAAMSKFHHQIKPVENPTQLFKATNFWAEINLNQENLLEFLELVTSFRLTGQANYQGKTHTLPDSLKMLFTINSEFLNSLPESSQDQILITFSPVFYFEPN